MSGPARPPIEPIERSVPLRFCSDEQLEVLRAATLRVLEEVGVRFDSTLARDILHGHGAQVDAETKVVRLPADLVEKAMARSPRSFVLGARDPSCELDLARAATFCTTDGCGTEIIDWVTGERRSSTKADLGAISRLQDFLPGISFWWPTVAAGDHGQTAQLHEIHAGWSNTVKHIQGFVQGGRAAEVAVDMATAVAGGPEQLRRRPVMSDLIGTVSPLVHDEDGTEAALVFAAAGIPVCFVTMPTHGSTAPATRAGAFAMGCAELVSGTVLLQLAHPGAPVLHSMMPSFIDPRDGSFLGHPLDGRGRALATELAHAWGVPAESAACGTDARTPGAWQGGVEDGLDLALAALEGSELMPAIGLLATYQLFSAEELILEHDIYQRARHAVMEVALDDEQLAFEAIADVGPGGHFLGHRHTRTHLRQSTVFAITHEPAEGGGYREPVEVARERALRLLDEYEPEPLPASLADELATIVSAADAELAGG
jgi:trimethylamine---corrinoid protein Co-methyltransferase